MICTGQNGTEVLFPFLHTSFPLILPTYRPVNILPLVTRNHSHILTFVLKQNQRELGRAYNMGENICVRLFEGALHTDIFRGAPERGTHIASHQ